jgi:uncharacterized Zn finger protein (UPF0148 family)
MKSENGTSSVNSTQDSEPVLGVDKKLADLMMRGWTLLADSCPIESCGCPLMRNLDGQKYCCGCEMWHFDKDRPVKQTFGELVSLKGKQNIQPRQQAHTEVSLPNKSDFSSFSLNKSVIQSLQLKLAYLSNILNNESDLGKSKEILECIQVCINNITLAKNLNI